MKNILYHTKTYHKKYIGGIFASFAVIKTFVLFAGFFGISLFGSTFAAGNELNSTNITQTPYNCGIASTNCDLSWQDIDSIASGTFANHTALLTLDLDGNQITTIEANTFTGLSSLKTLYLYDNQITTIEANTFAGLSSLDYLDLSKNEITTIEANTFAGLSSLDYLDLYSNEITTIESGAFAGLSSLEKLYLYSNEITTIESGAFAGLSSLDSLDLGRNLITSIQASYFHELPLLTALYLSDNIITGVVSDDFIGLSSLDILDLSRNEITTIESGAFAGLSLLNSLYLGSNKIATIESNTFDGLGMLKNLDLSSNQLLYLESTYFDGLSSLNYFYVYSNCIDPDLLSQDTLDFLNTPGFGWDSQLVCLDINYIPNTTTSGNVIGTLAFTGGLSGDRELLAIDNPTLSFYTWTGNGVYGFDLTSIIDDNYLLRANSNNQTTMTGEVTWIIDTTAPIATITYSPTETTANPVTATIHLNEIGTITNNSGNIDYIFTSNGSFIFEFSDLSGNTGTAIATVFWISVPTTGTTTSYGGNGGSTSLHKDDCPDGDYSYSYYDGSCGTITSNTGTTSHGSASCDITNSPYSSEFTQAFSYAYSLGITTQCPITKAHLSDPIIRSNFAKMISEFAIKTLKKQPNTKLDCSFSDIANESKELKFYIKTACQLNLMGRNSDGKTTQKNFNPRDTMTRAQIGTVISRLLYSQQNNTSDSVHWFTKHLQALKIGGIMNDISKPYTKELRGYIMLMLYRITK